MSSTVQILKLTDVIVILGYINKIAICCLQHNTYSTCWTFLLWVNIQRKMSSTGRMSVFCVLVLNVWIINHQTSWSGICNFNKTEPVMLTCLVYIFGRKTQRVSLTAGHHSASKVVERYLPQIYHFLLCGSVHILVAGSCITISHPKISTFVTEPSKITFVFIIVLKNKILHTTLAQHHNLTMLMVFRSCF